MSQWRGVLHRLTCFIRMIDFLVMELLRRLVLAALRTLLAQVKASSMQGMSQTWLLSMISRLCRGKFWICDTTLCVMNITVKVCRQLNFLNESWTHPLRRLHFSEFTAVRERYFNVAFLFHFYRPCYKNSCYKIHEISTMIEGKSYFKSSTIIERSLNLFKSVEEFQVY